MTTNASAAQFTYAETDVPTVVKGGKVAVPNPHRDIVLHLRSLVGTDSTEKRARSFTIAHLDDEGNVTSPAKGLPAPVARALRQLREAGDEYKNGDGTPAPFSVRTDVKSGSMKIGTGAKAREVPASLVTFWIHTVNGEAARITRTAKQK